MKQTHDRNAVRIGELRAMIAAYRQITIEEAELTDAGDLEIEMEAELWRLEQEQVQARVTQRRRHAA